VLQSRHLKRREDRGWVESEEWYYLFLSAISELTTATQVDLRIVTGLPVSFYTDKDGVRDKLLGEHRVQREGRSAQVLKVTDCRVIPQPFGSLLSLALDNQGRIVDNGLATGVVGVIDVGGKTTNLLSVNRLSEISRETSSVSVGAWSVARAVRAYIANHCPDLELWGHQILDAIKNMQVGYFGEPIDLREVIDSALAPLAEQVIAEATQLWNGAAGLDVILVSGGGALLLGPTIKSHFRHARIVSEPIFANAFGFWRFAQRLG